MLLSLTIKRVSKHIVICAVMLSVVVLIVLAPYLNEDIIYKCYSSVRSNPKPNTSFRRYGWHWQSVGSAIKLFILHRSPWRNKLDRFSLVRFVHPTLIIVSKTRAYESGAPFMCSVRQQTRFKSLASHKHSSLLIRRVGDNHSDVIYIECSCS